MGLDETVAALGAFAEGAGDLRRPAPRLAEAWYRNVARTVDTANEGTYPALKPSTVAKKEKAGQGGNPTLVATGAMLAAATSNSADSIYEVSDSSFILGLTGRSGEVAGFHQWGTEKMAARPLFVVTDRYAEEAAEIVVRGDIDLGRSLGFEVS